MITVTALELKALLDAQPGMALFNVRPMATASEGQIPGSRQLPQAEFEGRILAMLPDKNALVAVYDADLTCEASTRAATSLEKLGYKQVYNFSAGLKGWKEAGLPTL